jgi:hypothetical protein
MMAATLGILRGRLFAAAGLALGFVVVVGCGGGNEAYQVSGRAQYKDGSPITGGVRIIRLEPTQDSTAKIRKAASGMIAEDGSFEMFTRKPGDGVYAGKYAVTFSVLTKALGGTSLIPARFTRADNTPFTIEVDNDKEELLYELDKN